MSERRRADHTPSPAPTGPDPTSRRTCPPCTAPAAALPADVLVHSVGERGGGLRDPTSVQDRFSISRIDAEYGRSVAGTGYGLDTGGSTIGFPRKERKERRKSEYSLIRKSASPIVQKNRKKAQKSTHFTSYRKQRHGCRHFPGRIRERRMQICKSMSARIQVDRKRKI
jgi:hypothetical protein